MFRTKESKFQDSQAKRDWKTVRKQKPINTLMHVSIIWMGIINDSSMLQGDHMYMDDTGKSNKFINVFLTSRKLYLVWTEQTDSFGSIGYTSY